MPKCGAKRKRDGEPCRNLAMSNGKCRYHGGCTGKGANWGKHRLPPKDAAQWEARLARKFAQIERDKRRRAQRLAAMSPEERRRYDAWVKSHQPGPAAERARRRANLKAAADLRAISERADARPLSPELAALEAERRRIEREALLWSIENGLAEGVFG
ncbi:HGGxSTG domain-containing protein [Ollibium composti]